MEYDQDGKLVKYRYLYPEVGDDVIGAFSTIGGCFYEDNRVSYEYSCSYLRRKMDLSGTVDIGGFGRTDYHYDKDGFLTGVIVYSLEEDIPHCVPLRGSIIDFPSVRTEVAADDEKVWEVSFQYNEKHYLTEVKCEHPSYPTWPITTIRFVYSEDGYEVFESAGEEERYVCKSSSDDSYVQIISPSAESGAIRLGEYNSEGNQTRIYNCGGSGDDNVIRYILAYRADGSLSVLYTLKRKVSEELGADFGMPEKAQFFDEDGVMTEETWGENPFE